MLTGFDMLKVLLKAFVMDRKYYAYHCYSLKKQTHIEFINSDFIANICIK